MPLIIPERPTRNFFQDAGQTLQQAGTQTNLIADMVERRLQRRRELEIQEAEERRKQEVADREKEEAKRKTDTQDKLSKTIREGVREPGAETKIPATYQDMPGPWSGDVVPPSAPYDVPQAGLPTRRTMTAPARTERAPDTFRPPTEQEVEGIAAQGMDPYQTAALYTKPAAAATAHSYKMDEIGARGTIQERIAALRAKAALSAARMRKAAGRGTPKEWKETMDEATASLQAVNQSLYELETTKPKATSFAMKPWVDQRGQLLGLKKFYEGQVFKASQNGVAMPTVGDDETGEAVPDNEAAEAPPAPPARAPAAGPKARPLTDPNVARTYMQKAGGDKAKARAMAAADGWTF